MLNLMRPKFQKRSALKFDGRIIPEAKPRGVIWVSLGFQKRSALKALERSETL